MRVKIFREYETQDLEDEINKWLAKEENEIFKIIQSEDEKGMTVSIYYRKAE